MEKKIIQNTVNHAIKVIKLYIGQNPREFSEDTKIHEKDCEFNLGLTHGKCYCTEHHRTRLDCELDKIIEK